MGSNQKGSRGEVESGSDALLSAVEGAALAEPYGDDAEPALPYPLRRPGPDVRVEVWIVSEDAEVGVPMRVSINALVACPTCGGDGALPGSGRVPCQECSGSGAGAAAETASVRGVVARQEPCVRCGGYGLITPHPCPECAGEGRIPKRRDLAVQIPAGATDHSYVRMQGAGPVGPHRGAAGDVYVEVRVKTPRRSLLDRLRSRRD